jgi:hypothetical protein
MNYPDISKKIFVKHRLHLHYCKKECASAHSRAEHSLLRHSSPSCECAFPARSAFCFIGSSFRISYEMKKGPPKPVFGNW